MSSSRELRPRQRSSSSSFFRRLSSSLASASWISYLAPSESKPTSSPYFWAFSTKSRCGWPSRASRSNGKREFFLGPLAQGRHRGFGEVRGQQGRVDLVDQGQIPQHSRGSVFISLQP